MATIAQPIPGFLRRPRATEGFWGWFNTIDHKKIGVLYGVTAFFFFIVGGIEALFVRVQLAQPNLNFLSAEAYNQAFTMHGTTMVFLVIMPLGATFFNLMVPLMIGARDVAFPRLNALSYWLFLGGGILINTGWLIGAAPNDGWFGYANLTTTTYSPGFNIDFWALGLQILGIASLVAAFNFIVTILNMRAPGMTMTRLPVFVWMTLVVSFLLITAMPVISVALFELSFDRFFGAVFFDTTKGGDPILWQHLFWLFGHPEVYILILPAMGIVSEILPVFSRKPLFGYTFVVFSGIAIGFMGWSVWVHHMFTVGLGPVATSAFAISTMLIAVPTGVKIFNWIGTLHGGQISFKTPMMFSLGFIALFIIGGLSGVTHAVVPADTQQQDTYYIVAHFHYVLFGGALFGIFAGIYYWWPKFTGRMLNEGIGHWHFWLMFIGMNLTFGPMHVVGLNGMPRRIYTYPEGMGWDFWNMVETIGAFVIALSVAVFMYNVWVSLKNGKRAGNDPWDGRTLEWTIPSPPPEYNFEEVPVVRARDPFWHDKYIDPHTTTPQVAAPAHAEEHAPEHATTSSTAVAVAGEHGVTVHEEGGHGDHGHGIHMPSPSYFPFVAAVGLVTGAYGLLLTVNYGLLGYVVGGIGVAILLTGVYGWALEPVTDEHAGRRGDDMLHESHALSPIEDTATGIDNKKLFMWLFLASDCFFFGSFIATYMLYRGRSLEGPYPADVYDIPFTSVSSFVLLMSSLTMVLALAAIQRNDSRACRIWLLTTALLGMTFLGGQVFEFTEFYHNGLGLSTNLFGTTFFVLTGFHGTHVGIGVIILLSLFYMVSRGRITHENSLNVELAGLYWHFVDVVWIVIFTLVYLIP